MFKPAVLALLFLTDAQAINLNARDQGKHDFIKAMRESQKIHGKLPRKLTHDRLIAKSVHKPGLRSSDNEKPASTHAIEGANGASTGKPSQEPPRQLAWGGWNSWWKRNQTLTDEQMAEMDSMDRMNETEAQEYMENNGSWWQWNGWGSSSNNSTEDDQTDDMWSTGDNQTSAVMDSLADFSVKYAGCTSLTSFTPSDEDGSYPFNNQNFVTYRLCPSDSCADDSWNGCKSEYGEYLMNLDDFLQIQQDYIDEEYEYYCTFCRYCIYFDTYLSEDGQGCTQTDACEDYQDYCSDEARSQMEEEAEFSLEDFFECKEISIWGGDDGDGYYDDDVTVADDIQFDDKYDVYFKNQGKAYVGTHCNEGIIEIGLFADDQCIQYVGNQIDFFNATGYEVEASVVQEMYVPDGCLACNGDNIKTSGYWFPHNYTEGEEYQTEMVQNETTYVSEICYNMYSVSAKCHFHYGENNKTLELSDSELMNEQATCDFIEDVVKGYVDNDGFVYSHQNENTNPVANYFALFGADDMETEVTAAQGTALVVTGTATAALVAAAFHLRRKVEGAGLTEGLMANDAATSA